MIKVTGFYVNKKQRVFEEKDVERVLNKMAKVGMSASLIALVAPILPELVGMPIDEIMNHGLVAHAQSSDMDLSGLQEGTNKIMQVAEQLITSIREVAEPVSYAFAIKGIIEKMSGKEQVGDRHMKEALKGYVVIQFLPFIFSLLKVF